MASQDVFSQEERDWLCAHRIANELIAIAPYNGLGGSPMVWTADMQVERDELYSYIVGNYDDCTYVEINRLEAMDNKRLQCRRNFFAVWPFSMDKAALAFDYTYIGG